VVAQARRTGYATLTVALDDGTTHAALFAFK